MLTIMQREVYQMEEEIELTKYVKQRQFVLARSLAEQIWITRILLNC